jgi:hypothetical protein
VFVVVLLLLLLYGLICCANNPNPTPIQKDNEYCLVAGDNRGALIGFGNQQQQNQPTIWKMLLSEIRSNQQVLFCFALFCFVLLCLFAPVLLTLPKSN